MVTLTIAIPTYNRATLLDAQLTRIAAELERLPMRCELLVSDNCSTDDTPDVIASWQDRVPNADVRFVRQASNLGAMGNIAACIRATTSDFVWLIGDDDELPTGTIGLVVDRLVAEPDLAVLSLNYSLVNVLTGQVMRDARYALTDDVHQSVAGPFDRTDDAGVPLLRGMGFMTAQIYRTTAIQRAVAAWPPSENLEVQIYWSGACALEGPVRVVSDVVVEYACGDNLPSRPDVYYRCQNEFMPLVFLRLRSIGYPTRYCIREITLPMRKRFELGELLAGLVRWPGAGFRALGTIAYATVMACVPRRRSVNAPGPELVGASR